MPGKSTRLSKPSDSDYEDFLRSVKPVGIGLASLSSKLNRESYGRLMRQDGRGSRTISADYDLLEAEKGYFDTSARFLLTITQAGESNPALMIECVYLAHFHCKKTQREIAERFTKSELRLVLWPYFRELISDLCGKMAIPPITVPLSTTDGD